MTSDPLEIELEEDEENHAFYESVGEPITYIDSCEEWTNFCANLTTQMYNEWIASRNA